MPDAIADWDDAYANMAHIPYAESFLDRWPIEAQAFREAVNCELDIPYDDGERNRFDLFFPDSAPKGLFVFIHGGYWIRFDKSFWSHYAAGPMANGWAVAMPSYDLCPDVSVADITRQISNAIASTAERIDGPIILSGHSAGGHLVSRQVCEDSHLPGNVLERIRRVISISGVHDLRPLLKVGYNETIRLNEEMAWAESPALLKPLANTTLDCVVGAIERPEFCRQNDLLANIWHGLGAATASHHIDGKHHFDVIDDLKNQNGLICQLADQQ